MDFRRLFDLLAYQQARFPQPAALAIREDGRWRTYSTGECLEEVDRVSAALLDLGLQRGDRLAIMSSLGSPRWNFLDLGMQQIGVINVPIHDTVTPEELAFILRDSGARYVATAGQQGYDLLTSLRDRLPDVQGVFTLEALPGVPSWDQLSRPPTSRHLEQIAALRAAIGESDLATIVYTSGSTGLPKGVMLSHGNIVSNIKAVISLIPVNCEKRVLSMLPLSHIFERMVVYTYLAVGASIYYSPGRDVVFDDLREVRPHYFTAVPRMLEKMYDLLLGRSREGGRFRRRVWRWALALGKRYREGRRISSLPYWLRRGLADLLVYRHWRRMLGGQVEGIAVGAAALRPELGRLFSAAGIDIREGYGLTETSPVVCFNRFEPGGVRFGTVGIPIPGVEIRIDAPGDDGEGEVLVRGPNVMLGYYRDEAGTRQVIDADGWFRTGDVGQIVQRRFLRITGRKREVFKTSSGKFVAPEPLENLLLDSPFVEQCLVVGENRPFPAALIIPSFPLLRQWCAENQVHWTAPQFMVLNPKVIALFRQEIDTRNAPLPPHQRIRAFTLLFLPWTAENGELTPTLKPRRDVLRKKFAKEIDAMFPD